MAELLDVLIIGAGPSGLATAARLRENHPSALFTDEEQSRYAWIARNASRSSIKNNKTGHIRTPSSSTADRGHDRRGVAGKGPSMLVLDSSGEEWMAKWNALFKKFEIEHLRSPMFFHPDPSDRDALLAFAHERERMGELQEIKGCVGKEVSKHRRKKRTERRGEGPRPVVEIDERDRKDYFTPSTSCFRDFCEGCIQRYGLQGEHVIRQATATDVDFDGFPQVDEVNKVFRVSTNKGQHFARAVVLAIGGGAPVIPAPFPEKLPAAASHAMGMEEDCVLSQSLRAKIRAREATSALVIGGGLTSAQIADCLVRKGVRQVHLVMRGAWKVKPFDVDLSWMSKFRNQQRAAFWTADNLEERLDQAKAARNGGSMTPRFSKLLKTHIASGRLHVHTHTTISSQSYSTSTHRWTIATTPPPSPAFPEQGFDHIFFATGTQLSSSSLPLLRTVNRKYPVESHGGFPALTDDLKWCEDVPLFLTGKLAMLQVGPGAANLEGARACAERVAWGVGGMMDGTEGPGDGEVGGAGQVGGWKERYVAGTGSRFAGLREEGE